MSNESWQAVHNLTRYAHGPWATKEEALKWVSSLGITSRDQYSVIPYDDPFPPSRTPEAPVRVGAKHDNGKPRLDLLPPLALEEIAGVLAYGAGKYGDHNWRGGFAYGRLIAASLRHTFAWMRGEDVDTESGIGHLAHAACNLCFMLELLKSGKGEDDRYKGNK